MMSGKPINYFVISDLHMAEGLLANGTYKGTENFFADIEFSEFIDFLLSNYNTEQNTLIINGDFVDFIRQTVVPVSADDFKIWQSELSKVGVNFNVNNSSVDDKERDYGLKSNDYKSLWKLYLSINGHDQFFTALAKWVDYGNNLMVVVGNHDQEWIWELVQQYLKVKLYDLSSKKSSGFYDRISFIEDHTVLHDCIWIEHGHNFEMSTKFEKEMILDKSRPIREQELAWPFGNFFNRYFINKVELIFPYVDNLKSSQAMFQSILKEDFKSAFSLLTKYSWYMFYIINKFFSRVILNIITNFLLTVLPLALIAYLAYDQINNINEYIPKFENTLLNILKTLSPFLLRYVMKWILDMIGLSDKPIYKSALAKIVKKNKERVEPIKYFVLGHNHKAEKRALITNDKNEIIYLNSGSWTGSYEMKFKKIKLGVIYSTVHISIDVNGHIETEVRQWNPSRKQLLPIPSFDN